MYATTMRAQNLIVNDRISVTKERYSFPWSVDPLHFHPQDSVVIYLRGGYIWPMTSFYGPHRVRRGDVRVLPGNVLHTTGNAGSDSLEFLLIIPAWGREAMGALAGGASGVTGRERVGQRL